jgi:hypothetical protein
MTGKANRIMLTDKCAALVTDFGDNIALVDDRGGKTSDALCRGAVDE